jgi:hypothetical protein
VELNSDEKSENVLLPRKIDNTINGKEIKIKKIIFISDLLVRTQLSNESLKYERFIS